MPATVGGTVGASVIVVIGVIFAMFVARYDNEMNASAEKKDNDLNSMLQTQYYSLNCNSFVLLYLSLIACNSYSLV